MWHIEMREVVKSDHIYMYSSYTRVVSVGSIHGIPLLEGSYRERQ